MITKRGIYDSPSPPLFFVSSEPAIRINSRNCAQECGRFKLSFMLASLEGLGRYAGTAVDTSTVYIYYNTANRDRQAHFFRRINT